MDRTHDLLLWDITEERKISVPKQKCLQMLSDITGMDYEKMKKSRRQEHLAKDIFLNQAFDRRSTERYSSTCANSPT